MHDLWSRIARRRTNGAEQPAHCSVLDLGTEQARALVLELRASECAVVGVGRAFLRQPTGGMSGSLADAPVLTRACDRALREAEDMTEQYCGRQVVPDWVVVGLPNRATTADTLAATIRRPNSERRVTDKELREAVKRAQRLALSQLSQTILPLQWRRQQELELLEAEVADILIDGRHVRNPVGVRGGTVTVAVCNVVASSPYLRIVEAMTELLGLGVLAMASGWQALAHTVVERDAICVDVGGRSTDVMLVRNGKPWRTSSIPVGGREFTKLLAQGFNLPWTEAESLKLAYSLGSMDASSEARIRAAVQQPLDALVIALEDALGRMCGDDPLPHQFVLCGGGSGLPGIEEAVRSHRWMERLDFTRHPEVRLMSPGEVDGVLDVTGQLEGQQHVTSMAIARYAMAGTAEPRDLEALLQEVKRAPVSVGGGWA